MNYWVWVFGEVAGLRWVLRHNRIAFPEHATQQIRAMACGDRAILYVTRGAFHNPTRDETHLAGIATVVGKPGEKDPPVVIAGREFTVSAPIRADVVLPERTGPAVRPLAPRLSLVRKPKNWGNYFRPSPIAVTEEDFSLLEQEVWQFARTHS